MISPLNLYFKQASKPLKNLKQLLYINIYVLCYCLSLFIRDKTTKNLLVLTAIDWSPFLLLLLAITSIWWPTLICQQTELPKVAASHSASNSGLLYVHNYDIYKEPKSMALSFLMIFWIVGTLIMINSRVCCALVCR